MSDATKQQPKVSLDQNVRDAVYSQRCRTWDNEHGTTGANPETHFVDESGKVQALHPHPDQATFNDAPTGPIMANYDDYQEELRKRNEARQ